MGNKFTFQIQNKKFQLTDYFHSKNQFYVHNNNAGYVYFEL